MKNTISKKTLHILAFLSLGAGLIVLCWLLLCAFGCSVVLEYAQTKSESEVLGTLRGEANFRQTVQMHSLPKGRGVLQLQVPVRAQANVLRLSFVQGQRFALCNVYYQVLGIPVLSLNGTRTEGYLAETQGADLRIQEETAGFFVQDGGSILLKLPQTRFRIACAAGAVALGILAVLLILQGLHKAAARQVSVRTAVFIAVFLAMLYVPALYMWVPSLWTQQNLENRTLAEKPQMDLLRLEQTAREYESYFNDHSPFKKELVIENGLLRYRLFGKLPTDQVICGKDSWLFYNSAQAEGAGSDTIGDYRGLTDFSLEEMEQVRQVLEKTARYCEEQGSEFYLMICPSKESIYGGDYLPDAYTCLQKETRADRLVAYLRKNSSVRVIYPKEELMNLRNRYPLYFKMDTHWNDLGAYVGYRQLSEACGIEGLPALTELEVVRGAAAERDLAQMTHLPLGEEANMQPNLPDKWDVVEEKMPGSALDSKTFSTNPNGKKLLMCRDSYAISLLPYLAQDYAEGTYLWGRYVLDDQLMQAEQPDVVVWEIVERYLSPVLLADDL